MTGYCGMGATPSFALLREGMPSLFDSRYSVSIPNLSSGISFDCLHPGLYNAVLGIFKHFNGLVINQ